ncbi:MAB_1171c family putative transporter [Streptomyces spectabilis]|uniref:DUF6545 domain-containing protein n=1 Tax=Streptomyces spectabilis TaxID=68270 RepID=A0A5P2XIJ1_STRST|nr:MAB_1171c family putative transporter [Streptomyces spectabilis]MBB5102603.1 hypothetical protein [Streptomyces spectabilis]MCI3907642.1 hypothetical protein [Streptomyces spectabilis]QEV64328.1 hypothetical protein CP982_41215 [Streptomyces spectabilis]GGV30871.1 hypothetical protein GCM10010245_49960 [Streptomyces spectabilis]
MQDSAYYFPAAALAVATAAKTPALIRHRHDPFLRSVCALLVLSVAVFFFAAPPTIAAVNDLTGIVNFSAPLVYCVMSAFSAACLALIINWRGGRPEDVRRAARGWITAYGVVIVLLITLFVRGDAPVERLRDLDTYYANTPYIREMIVLYLVSNTVAAVVMTTLCWRWSMRVHGWLRAGLVVIVIGYAGNLAFDATKYAAVVARWNGADWDEWSTDYAPPLAAGGAVTSAVGYLLPLVGQRLSDARRNWSAFRALGPLWRALHRDALLPPVPMPWWSSSGLRLTQREAAIYDGLLALTPRLDPAVHERARARALRAGAHADEAEAIALAAMVVCALDGRGEIRPPSEDASSPTLAVSSRVLVRMSRALAQSPVVHAVRQDASRGVRQDASRAESQPS